jgi:hypothetical protein
MRLCALVPLNSRHMSSLSSCALEKSPVVGNRKEATTGPFLDYGFRSAIDDARHVRRS